MMKGIPKIPASRLSPLRIISPRWGRVFLLICCISLTALWAHHCQHQDDLKEWASHLIGPPALHSIDLSAPDLAFISWPLARVCSEALSTPGLVFMCDNNSGGIGNIRSFILTCLRYAIEAGATGLVMPQIETRSDSDLAELFKGYKPFNYFFDEAHFRDSLTTSCPQITIYDNADAVPNLKNTRPEMVTPKHYGLRGGCDQRDLNRHTDVFGPRFRDWLEETASQFKPRPLSTAHPRLVRLNWGVQWEWPVWKDGPEFANTFGTILRFRQDLLDIGTRAAVAMRRFTAGGQGEYLGAHLRTEHDALKGWPDFRNQSIAYLTEGHKRGYRTVYLATGNSTEASKFKAKARSQYGMRVVTKNELFESQKDDLQLLRSLSWDQQALIDYIVLLESSYFVGVSPSSFSMSVALKRHLKAEGLYTRPWKVGRECDGRSHLVGRYDSYWEDWLFMYESLWP